jgi:hypothetical protein
MGVSPAKKGGRVFLAPPTKDKWSGISRKPCLFWLLFWTQKSDKTDFDANNDINSWISFD